METLDKDGVESYINNLEVTDSISSFLARCRKGFCVNSKYVHDYEDNIQYTRDCNYGFISQNISSCGWFNRYENSNYAELREGHYEADYCIERSYLSYPNWIEDEDGVFGRKMTTKMNLEVYPKEIIYTKMVIVMLKDIITIVEW